MIDEKQLRELADDFGSEDLMDLIESFLDEAAEAVTELGAMVSDEYSEERAAQFHFLKGCAVNVGANDLAGLCERYEHRRSGFAHAEYQSILGQFHEVQAYFSTGGLKKIA